MIAVDPTALARVLEPAGIGYAVLFGSRVRGSARPDSDLDLGLERADHRRLTHRELSTLKVDLSELYGVEVDVVDLRTADALVRFEIASHGRLVYECVPGSHAAFVARTLIDHDDIAPMLDACIRGVGRVARGLS